MCDINIYFYKYAIISPKIGKIQDYCQNMNLFCGWYVLNVRFFCVCVRKYVKILLKIDKIRYFLALVRKYKLSSQLIFYDFFLFYFINTLHIILLKTGKISCKPVIYELSWWLIFLDVLLLFYLQKYYSVKNWQNLWLIVKIWIFIMADIF